MHMYRDMLLQALQEVQTRSLPRSAAPPGQRL